MSNISMVEAELPPGFRFHPKDDELVCDYLMRKVGVTGCTGSLLMIEVDLNKCEPWDIPETACVGGKEWYFYSQRDRKYATGLRTNRATATGYWKATGKDRPIYRKGALVGMRKTLVFYQGRAPKGRKTDWVMHEFRVEGPLGPPKISSLKEDWVLCRVFFKNREAGLRPSCYSLGGGNSSLPPLMDSYVSFNPPMTQPPAAASNSINSEYDDEQVPCFSNIFSQLPNPIFPQHEFLNAVPTNCNKRSTDVNVSVAVVSSVSASVAAASYSYGSPMSSSLMAVSQLGSRFDSCNYRNNSNSDNNNSHSDKKVLKAVLSQLTKMEANNSNVSLGEGASSDSFMSEVGIPTIASTWVRY